MPGAELPGWLKTALQRPVPESASRASRIVLLEEEIITATKSTAQSRVREAVKIQDAEGLRHLYLTAGQRIRQDFKLIGGWKIRPDGSVTEYDRKTIIQADADDSNQFSMNKTNLFRPEGTRVGDVVGWEYELRSKPEFFTEMWLFGGGEPRLLSRFGLKLPSGWTYRFKVLNHPDLSPHVDDGGHAIWEMRDVPAIEGELMGTAFRDLTPTLMVAYGTGEGSKEERQFETWEKVAGWYGEIVAGQVVTSKEIQGEAARLAFGADSRLDAIRAITEFVQGVRYLNVAVGRSVAEPHLAADILKNRFGDCEDKSVLTIALLREIGVDAYATLARTSDTGTVPRDFPAPNLFNHAIVAIQAPEGANVPSTMRAGALGDLIIFDPTSTSRGLGDLSPFLQGTHAVLAHGTDGGLVTLPVLPPEASSREAEYEITFAERGGIDLEVTATYKGDYAASRRSYYQSVRGKNRAEAFATYLKSNYGGGDVEELELQGVESPGEPLVMSAKLWMPVPGQDLRDLRTIPAHFLLGTRVGPLPDVERETPLMIDAGFTERERYEVRVPPGWNVVGPLPALEATGPVGEYFLAAREAGGRVVVERLLTVKRDAVSPAEYAGVREFFDEVDRGDALSVALERR